MLVRENRFHTLSLKLTVHRGGGGGQKKKIFGPSGLNLAAMMINNNQNVILAVYVSPLSH